MPTELNISETAEGSVFTASTDNGSAVAVLDRLMPGVASQELELSYAALTPALNQLQTSVAAIVHNSHPRLVDEQILGVVKRDMPEPINRVIDAGRSERRLLAEAIDRASQPTVDVDRTLRGVFQARLVNMEPTEIMQTAMKPNAPVELVLAALDTATITGLPDDVTDTIRELMLLRTAKVQVSSEAGAAPTPHDPFAIGIDQERADTLAEEMLKRHRRRVEAVDTVKHSVSRLLTMLAVLSGASGPGEVWTAIRDRA